MAERSFVPTPPPLSLLLFLFLSLLGVSSFSSPSFSSQARGEALAVFFVFFWEEDPFPPPTSPLEIWVGDGRFLALESEGDCCFNGVVLRESNARDGRLGW